MSERDPENVPRKKPTTQLPKSNIRRGRHSLVTEGLQTETFINGTSKAARERTIKAFMQVNKIRTQKIRKIGLHEYYTPKEAKIQDVFRIFAIFVDYDNIYVNIVMSTCATTSLLSIRILSQFPRCWFLLVRFTPNIVFASFLASDRYRVNLAYLPWVFVQLNKFRI